MVWENRAFEEAHMNGLKVAIVDDDNNVREEISETLSLGECDVSSFADGFSALENIEKIDPDVILIDLKMKGMMGGFELAQGIRCLNEKMQHVPIIAMSGQFHEDSGKTIMDFFDIEGFLVKPVMPSEILKTVVKSARHLKRQ